MLTDKQLLFRLHKELLLWIINTLHSYEGIIYNNWKELTRPVFGQETGLRSTLRDTYAVTAHEVIQQTVEEGHAKLLCRVKKREEHKWADMPPNS